MIGSRFDMDVSKATCRLAFYGRLAALVAAEQPAELARLRVYKLKRKVGALDRVAKDSLSAVCRGMFKKETDISLFAGMRVWRPFPSAPHVHLTMDCFVIVAPLSDAPDDVET